MLHVWGPTAIKPCERPRSVKSVPFIFSHYVFLRSSMNRKESIVNWATTSNEYPLAAKPPRSACKHWKQPWRRNLVPHRQGHFTTAPRRPTWSHTWIRGVTQPISLSNPLVHVVVGWLIYQEKHMWQWISLANGFTCNKIIQRGLPLWFLPLFSTNHCKKQTSFMKSRFNLMILIII